MRASGRRASSPPACRWACPPAPTWIRTRRGWALLTGESYEVDLFGRVSDTINATRSDYESNVATFRSVTLALQADVAQTYFWLRATDDELRILRETVYWRDESVRLLQRRFDLGDQRNHGGARENRGVERAHRSDRTRVLAWRARTRARSAHRQATRSAHHRSPPLVNELPAIPGGSAVDPARAGARTSRRRAGRWPAANSRIGAREIRVLPGAHPTAAGGFESADLADLFNWSSRTWLSVPGGHHSHCADHRRRAQPCEPRAHRGSAAGVRLHVHPAGQPAPIVFAEVEDNLVALRTLDWGSAARRRISAPRSAARLLKSQTCATTRRATKATSM